jgi:uncharacterized protein YsxB (DUF464 family)
MTTVIISKKNGRLFSLSVTGHTGFDEAGKDILCASISTLVQTAGQGIKKFVTKDVILDMNVKQPRFFIRLPDNLSEQQYLQAELILNTCILGINDLRSGYQNYIKVEVKNNVY